MNKKTKSQVASEFLFFVAIGIVVTIIFVALFLRDIKALYGQEEQLQLKDIAIQLKNEISIASTVHDGYSRDFELPASVRNHDYNISARNNSVSVFTNTSVFTVRVLDFSGSISKGANTISRQNGVVSIS